MRVRKIKKCLNVNLIVLFLIALQLGVIILSMNKKVDFHVDEYFTYGFANSASGIWGFLPEDNVQYSGDNVFLNYLTVDMEHRFDYSLVWNNQALDTHPPFYYAVMHTFCSFFPGTFTRWFGLAANAIFFVIASLLIYAIAKKVFYSSGKALFTLLVWGGVTGTVNTAIFIRMYMMVTVFVLAIIFIHLRIYEQNKLTWKFYLELLLLTIGGALTHYYFLIFIFFTAVFYSIYMLVYRRYKELGMYIITYVIAGVTSIAIFPTMLYHIFSGGRGKEAFEAFENGTNYFNKFIEYLKLVTYETVGNIWIFSVLCIFTVIFFVNCFSTYGLKETIYKIFKSPFAGIFIIGLGYSCIVIRIAPYMTTRYISPVYGLIILSVVAILIKMGTLLCTKPIMKTMLIGAFGILIICGTWDYGVQNLFSYKQNAIDTAIVNYDKDVLYVYDGQGWKLPCNRKELINFRSFTFVQPENLEQYLKEKDLDNSFLYVTATLDQASIIEQIEATEANIDMEYLYNSDYAAVYKISMQ